MVISRETTRYNVRGIAKKSVVKIVCKIIQIIQRRQEKNRGTKTRGDKQKQMNGTC